MKTKNRQSLTDRVTMVEPQALAAAQGEVAERPGTGRRRQG
jgi:hypothetical protein